MMEIYLVLALVGIDVVGICDGILEVGNLLGIIVGTDVDDITGRWHYRWYT